MDCQSEPFLSSSASDEGEVDKMQVNLALYESKLKERKRCLARLKSSRKGGQLEAILGDLLHLESQLRKEQSYLFSYVMHQSETIETQRQEIERLRRDNRRLIKRVTKISETKNFEADDDNSKEFESTTESDYHYADDGKSLNEVGEKSNLLNDSASFVHNSARIKHKPPIPEKPKFVAGKPMSSTLPHKDPKSSIVSTIGLLLDETEITVAGESESSSPDSSFKSTAPRVLRLAKQFENVMIKQSVYGDESRSLGKNHSEDQEVTSGYNSDSISDLDHDYEMICFGSGAQSEVDRRVKEITSTDSFGYPNGSSEISGPVNGNGSLDEFGHYYSNVEFNRNDRLSVAVESSTQSGMVDRNGNSSQDATSTQRSREPGLMDNFEEFKFDSLDFEDLKENDDSPDIPVPYRIGGDGAEDKNRATILDPSPVKSCSASEIIAYEKFLEITGLSQKSILSPSRMFSNHRSMLKPRDIKHRDKLRSAFAFSVSEENQAKHCLGGPKTSGGDSLHRYETPFV